MVNAHFITVGSVRVNVIGKLFARASIQPYTARMEKNLWREKTFRAAMFDYDGTLTDLRHGSVPPVAVADALNDLTARGVALGLCSGRPLPQALEKLQLVLREGFENNKKHWFICVENGGAGYAYDRDRGDFVEVYREKWPEELFSQKEFEAKARELFVDHSDYIFMHESCLIVRPLHYPTLDSAGLIAATDELEKIGAELLRETKTEDFLTLGNSGLGLVILLKSADKGRAAREFGKLLGLREPFSEIALFGDRPMKHGNDEGMLNGSIGTPFTVGFYDATCALPLPVLDDEGKRLTGPLATAFQLKRLKFEK